MEPNPKRRTHESPSVELSIGQLRVGSHETLRSTAGVACCRDLTDGDDTMAPTSTQKRLEEFAAHFQVQGHDDVFVLSSSTADPPRVMVTPEEGIPNHQDSPVFNTCLTILAAGAAILALHLITRHYQEDKNGALHHDGFKEKEAKEKSKRSPASSPPPAQCLIQRRQTLESTTKPNNDPPALMPEQQQIVTHPVPRETQISMVPHQVLTRQRPLKARVQEIVEISKTMDGMLSESRALDVAVRLAQMESNETIKLTELAMQQWTSFRKADQKERHHREMLEEQGKDRTWRSRLDAGVRDTIGELLSTTSMLALFLTLSVVLDYFASVWNDFKANPLAYTTGLVCEQGSVENSKSSAPMWFVGTWAYEYIQATKTDLICGLSIAQYLTAFVAIVGVHSCLPGIIGKSIQHVCLGAVLIKISLRLMELEEMLLGACGVGLFFVLFGGGVLCYYRYTKNFIGRLKRLPTVMEMDAVDDVFDQAKLGFVICKVLAGAFLLSKAVSLAWNKRHDV